MKFMRAVWSPVPTTLYFVCIICMVTSVMHSLGLNFIAPSPRTGYKPVHNMPCAVHWLLHNK